MAKMDDNTKVIKEGLDKLTRATLKTNAELAIRNQPSTVQDTFRENAGEIITTSLASVLQIKTEKDIAKGRNIDYGTTSGGGGIDPDEGGGRSGANETDTLFGISKMYFEKTAKIQEHMNNELMLIGSNLIALPEALISGLTELAAKNKVAGKGGRIIEGKLTDPKKDAVKLLALGFSKKGPFSSIIKSLKPIIKLFKKVGSVMKKFNPLKLLGGPLKLISKVIGGLFSIVTGTLNLIWKGITKAFSFIMKPLKLIADNAGKIFGAIMTFVLLGAIVAFLKSPLWQKGKESLGSKIGAGIKFVVENSKTMFKTTFEYLKEQFIKLGDFFDETVFPMLKRIVASFFDSTIIRHLVGDSYGEGMNTFIEENKEGGRKDKIAKLDKRREEYEKLEAEKRTEILLKEHAGESSFFLRLEAYQLGIVQDTLLEKIDNLKAKSPEQLKITENIDKILAGGGGSGAAGVKIIQDNKVDKRSNTYNTTSSAITHPYAPIISNSPNFLSL